MLRVKKRKAPTEVEAFDKSTDLPTWTRNRSNGPFTVKMVPKVWHITSRTHLRELDEKWFMTLTFEWP